MKSRLFALWLTIIVIPTLAMAQKSDDVVAELARDAVAREGLDRGASVTDKSGTLLGIIESVDEQFAVLVVGPMRALLPLSAFEKRPTGWTCLLDRQQIDEFGQLVGDNDTVAQ